MLECFIPAAYGTHTSANNGSLCQRVTRLHQLLSAIAKLAAAISSDVSLPATPPQFDTVRLSHSTFLADAVLDREQRHMTAMTTALFRLSATRPTSDPLPPPPA